MSSLLLQTLPLPRRERYASAFVWLCAGTLLALDLSLYHIDRSWTPLHYESLAPLLALCGVADRARWTSALAAMLLFGTIAVLFFAFGLTWRLAAESWSFVAGVAFAAIAWLLPAVGNALRHRRPPAAFVVLMVALLGADKVFCHDMLSSFFLPHFLRLHADTPVSPSANPVYASLKSRLAPDHGGVLIVFEALGVPKDRAVLNRLQLDFPDFAFTTPDFEGGSTVSAEVRYVCGVNGTIADYTSCLPHRLPSRAMHGNSLSYFSRNLLYRDMGFNASAGRHELGGLRNCRYAYTAVCDDALWDRLAEQVRESSCRDFSYALSIDSHFPYRKYAHHVEGLYSDLRNLLGRMRRLKEAFPQCLILIAGDHPPPLTSGFEGKQVLVVSTER